MLCGHVCDPKIRPFDHELRCQKFGILVQTQNQIDGTYYEVK